jgi:hypothetical protein
MINQYVRFVCVALGLMACAAAFGGCAYGGIAAVGNKVVVTRNDGLLYGVLRKIYVCEVKDDGSFGNCQEGEAP